MDQALYNMLEELGFTPRQSKVYLALLKNGSASAIQIARETGLRHPTVYDALDLLKDRGLVSEIQRNGRRTFAAESPLNLHRAEERRRQALDSAMPQLLELYAGGDRRPVIRCYTGDEASQILTATLLNCRDREYFYFGQVSAMLRRSSPEEELEYLKQRLERQVISHSIRLQEEASEPEYMTGKKEYLRQVRYITLPDATGLPELYLVDNQVLIRSGVAGDQLLVIESPDLHLLFKRLWELVWQHAVAD